MAAATRVSAAYAEVVSAGAAKKSRVSAAYAEVVSAGTAKKSRVSSVYVEVIGAPVVTSSGAGAANGSASASGAGAISHTVVNGAGAAAGSATVSGVGARITADAGAGVAAGSAAVSGVGAAIKAAAGVAAGSAAVSGVGAAIVSTGIFPTLPAIEFPVFRRPRFRTIVAKHSSGADARTEVWAAPLWEFEVSLSGVSVGSAFPNLLPSSYQTLMGFYLSMGGQYQSFLFRDPDFNATTGAPIGTGDGSTVAFTFNRLFAGFTEPASYVTGSPTVYLNGVAQSAVGWQVVKPNNLVFASAPASGAVITADFSYEFLCRFIEDDIDFEQILVGAWAVKSLKFRQVRT